MRPRKIWLVRHGESEGNVDAQVYYEKPDHALSLTEKGIQQAKDAGVTLKADIQNRLFEVWSSPFKRTRQTTQYILESFPEAQYRLKYDSRLVEQDWGCAESAIAYKNLWGGEDAFWKSRERHGKYFFRMPNGESCSDVEIRQSSFMETLHRDFQSPVYPTDVIIVGHGMQLRVFLSRWLHWDIEYFESLRNPRNCEIFCLTHCDKGRWEVDVDLSREISE